MSIAGAPPHTLEVAGLAGDGIRRADGWLVNSFDTHTKGESMKRKLALYVRVSTTGQSVDGQLHKLRQYAEGRDEEVVEYADEGVSGARASRPNPGVTGSDPSDHHRGVFGVAARTGAVQQPAVAKDGG